jgi:uncharacterized protein YukE
LTELGQTSDPVALVPGSAAGVGEAAAAWRSKAGVARDAGARLQSLRTPEGWDGDAAAGFAARRVSAAESFTKLADVLVSCADALDAYVTTLGWAQQKAGDAIAMWAQAQTLTLQSQREQRQMERLAGPTDILPPAVDGGEHLRIAAKALLAHARAELDAAGSAAATTVEAAASVTPESPDPWQVAGLLISAMFEMQVTLHWNSLVDIVNGAASFGNALIQHPETLLAILGGGAMIGGGVGLMGGGGAVSLTGIGATVGAPAAAGGFALAGAGVAAAGAGAVAAAVNALGPDRVELLERRGEDRGDGRDDGGRYANGQESKPWVDKEAQGVKEVEDELGVQVRTDKVRANVEGTNRDRFFDGFFKNDDGTYTGVEIKSGSATQTASQREFDSLVTRDNPATATIDGEVVRITGVYVKKVS